MIAWIFGLALAFLILDLIFTGGRNVRKDFGELFSMFMGIVLIIMFFRWIFSK